MRLTEHWTIAKAGDQTKNEDQAGFGRDFVVLADGATDKAGIDYPSGYTGGRELADIAVAVASQSHSAGYNLAKEVTDRVRSFYADNNPDALIDPSKRAATTLVAARIVVDKLVVTQIGDTNVRLLFTNGELHVLSNDKLIDEENSVLRAQHIANQLLDYEREHGQPATGDDLQRIIASGRDVITERLKRQYELQNSATDQQYGYGTIDGSEIPREYDDGTPTNYVKQFMFDADSVTRIELVSDGFYGEFPAEATTQAYQELYAKIHETDPHKHLKYLSTKPLDDATVVIGRF